MRKCLVAAMLAAVVFGLCVGSTPARQLDDERWIEISVPKAETKVELSTNGGWTAFGTYGPEPVGKDFRVLLEVKVIGEEGYWEYVVNDIGQVGDGIWVAPLTDWYECDITLMAYLEVDGEINEYGYTAGTVQTEIQLVEPTLARRLRDDDRVAGCGKGQLRSRLSRFRYSLFPCRSGLNG